MPILFFAAARFMTAYYGDILDGFAWLEEKTGIRLRLKAGEDRPGTLTTILVFGLPTLCSYFLVECPWRFGAVVTAIWLGTFLTAYTNERKKPEEYRSHFSRSFFGTMKIEPYRDTIYVINDNGEKERVYSPMFNRLVHGTTVHGMQHQEPDGVSIGQALLLLGANTPADAIGLSWIADPHLRYPEREPLTYYHRPARLG